MQYRVGGVHSTGLTVARGVRRCPQFNIKEGKTTESPQVIQSQEKEPVLAPIQIQRLVPCKLSGFISIDLKYLFYDSTVYL